jgi:drug/metabolite transporter (DMT)-like permease
MPTEMPPQVRRAVGLMWFGQLAAIVATLIAISGDFVSEMKAIAPIPHVEWWFWGCFIAVFVGYAVLIVCVSRRQNWARITILLLSCASLLLMLWPDIYEEPLPWDWWVSNVAFGILDVLTLYWLFTGAGAAWFAKPRRRTDETAPA